MNYLDFVHLDRYSDADIRGDFNRPPYPFRDSSFSAIFARHTLEHVKLGMIVDVMKEIHRIGGPGGLVYIRVPYWNSKAFAQDPTHQTRFTEDTFYHFCGMMGTQHYIPKLFDLVEVEHKFHPKLWFIPRFAKLKLMNLMSEVCTEMWVTLRVVK
jgi:predicted SAM-dependent methyltransferase